MPISIMFYDVYPCLLCMIKTVVFDYFFVPVAAILYFSFQRIKFT